MKISDDLKLTNYPVKFTPGAGDYSLRPKIPSLNEYKHLCKISNTFDLTFL